MLVVLNLKMSHERYSPPMGNPHIDEIKIDFVLIKKSDSSVTIQCKVQTKLLNN